MKFGINTLDDVDVKGKTVLIRLDLNEPIDRKTGTLKDITRIKVTIPTLEELIEKGAKVVIMTHQGSDIEYKNFYSTKPHALELSKLLHKQVKHVEDVCGPMAIAEIKDLKEGEALLLENVRYMSEEQTLFELNLIQKLAPLADLYICDAFAAAHRDQPSICGFEQVLPSIMGRLFEKEFRILSEIMENPKRDCVFILGGAKIADAFAMMNTVLSSKVADYVLTGGVVANILLASNNVNIGNASLNYINQQGYASFIETGRDILSKFRNKVILPTDLSYVNEGKRFEIGIDKLPENFALIDIGQETVNKYRAIISSAKTVFTNGPMGIFEDTLTEFGTKEIWKAISETEAFTVIGGGDSITATNKYNLQSKMSYICTGGGALIRFLTGEELPAVKALRYAATHNNGELYKKQEKGLKI
mgnify:FL=1